MCGITGAKVTVRVERSALFVALSAYVLWGCFPLFFVMLKDASVLEILGHRIIWSAVFLLFAAKLLNRLRDIRKSLQNRGALVSAFLSAALLAANWAVFIYAVESREVLAASLGHLLTPLVTVFLGVLLFNERLYRLQWVAVFIAFIALASPIVSVGHISWITVSQTATFSVYGLLHKKKQIDGFLGMVIETLTMVPVGMAILVFVEVVDRTTFDFSTSMAWLLILSGVVTATPLVAFSIAAKKLPLATLGFFASIIPSLQFFIAIFVLGETLTVSNGVVYGTCWLALVLYLTSAWRGSIQKAGDTELPEHPKSDREE